MLRELSIPTRVEILRAISVKPMALEKIASKLGVSVKETSAHIDRLSYEGLVEQGPGGAYRTGHLGQLALSFMPALDFIEAHKDYFRDHELSLLPPAFVVRLGDLHGSERTDGTLSNLRHAKRLIGEADIFLAVLANEVMTEVAPVVREKVGRGIEFVIAIDETFETPANFRPAVAEAWRVVPRIPAATVVTDNEAIVAFPDPELKIDYSIAFRSKEPTAIQWCRDLVETLWRQGHRLAEFDAA